MEGIGYWLFLLILYMLSTMMKKRQQRSTEGDEGPIVKGSWQTPDFVKDIFSDFVDSGEEELEEAVMEEFDEEQIESIAYQEQDIITPDIPLEETHLAEADLSPIDEEQDITTITHKDIQRRYYQHHFFKKQSDIRLAVVYKEILDKPRALRRSIR